MIFQEPGTSLNPVLTVGEQIMEVLARHTSCAARRRSGGSWNSSTRWAFRSRAPRRRIFVQLSGGMKQRVMIASALAGEPDLLIADRPTTALDVTIQAQVLDLARSLQARAGMAIFLITHDLGVVSEMAHRVAVMYAGEIVETASREKFFASPAHPYSRKLFDSLPGQTKRGGSLAVIRGTVPPLSQEFRGCRFADRCDFAWDLCRETPPRFHEMAKGHGARCHLYGDEGGGRMREGVSSPSSVLHPSSRVPHPSREAAPLLAVTGLKVHFPIHKGLFKRVVGQVKAVDGVSLKLQPGRTLALVGESGCGKTTVAKGILQLIAQRGKREFSGAN